MITSCGISKIETAPILTDGGMGTTLTEVGTIYQGTAKFTEDDPAITEHFGETSDDLLVMTAKRGKKTVEFTLIDITPAMLTPFLGGTAGGIAPALTYAAPDVLPSTELSLKITTTEGYIISIPRARIIAKVNWGMSQQDIAKVEVKAYVLKPTKANTKSWNILFA